MNRFDEFVLEDNKLSTTNFDILLGEAIDTLHEQTVAQLGEQRTCLTQMVNSFWNLS